MCFDEVGNFRGWREVVRNHAIVYAEGSGGGEEVEQGREEEEEVVEGKGGEQCHGCKKKMLNLFDP